MVVMIGFLILNWREFSEAIGHGFSRKRAQKKKQSKTAQTLIWLSVWAIALYVLSQKCGGLFCKTSSPASTIPDQITGFVSGSGSSPTLPLLGPIIQLSSVVQRNWFDIAFLGLLVVSAVILVRGAKVYLEETRADALSGMPLPRAEGIAAVEEAIQILKTQKETDPRTRIINCYQRMIQAAQSLGANITSDQTARELEVAIRKTLAITSAATRGLTDLFEEARYSLHPMIENDAEKAQQYLLDISEEMDLRISV